MGLFRRSRQTEDRSLSRDNIPSVMLSTLPSAVSPTTSMQVNDCWACVRLLSSTAASLPLIPYRRVTDGRERVTGGKLPSLLERPAPATTQAAFIAKVMVDLLLQGNSFVGLYKDGPDVVQLGTLPPDRIQVEIKAGQPFYRYTPVLGEQVLLTVDDVCHVRGLTSLDGIVGLSVIKQAAAAIGLSAQLADHAQNLMSNDATPRGVLKLQRFGDVDAQVEALRTAFETQHKGTTNAGKIAVVAGDVDFASLGLPPGDLQFLEQRKWSTVEIARAFGIPAHLISASYGASLNYTTTEMQATEFLKFSLAPWLTQIEQSLSNHPGLCSDRQYCEFNVEGLLRADSSARAEFYKVAADPIVGWMSRREIREKENLPPEEPSDGPTVEQIVATARPAGAATTNGGGS